MISSVAAPLYDLCFAISAGSIAIGLLDRACQFEDAAAGLPAAVGAPHVGAGSGSLAGYGLDVGRLPPAERGAPRVALCRCAVRVPVGSTVGSGPRTTPFAALTTLR